MTLTEEQSASGRREDGTACFRSVLAVQLLVSVFYLGMEWLFFATKASFMDSFSAVEKLGSFVIPPVALSLVALPLILLLGLLDLRFPKVGPEKLKELAAAKRALTKRGG